ncbi:MAG: peptidylprolyl isomerase [Verrucomicrobiota bacterium]
MRFVSLLCALILAAPAFAAPPAAPTNLTAVATSATMIRLDWVDNSSDETGFEVYRRTGVSGTFFYLGDTSANIISLNLPASQSTTYQYAIRSFRDPGGEVSDIVGPVTVTTPPPIVASPNFINGLLQTPFSFNITSTFPGSVTGYTITALPPGLSFNSATGAITGTPTTVGRTDAQVTISHSGFADATANLSFEIFINPPALLPPAVSSPLPNLTLTAGTAAISIPASSAFTDPDVSSAARLTTDLGTIDFAFYQNTAPQTVANFLGYLNRGDFLNTMFHRSVPGFILQGGAFRADATASAVPTQPPVVNEPRITNLAGTVAMAKLGGNPNSATNQFFINLANNAANLDAQNFGFTVFARVAGNGMTVAQAISELPLQNFSTTNGALTHTPVRISPAPVGAVPYNPTQLVRVNAASTVSPLSLAATSSDTAIATAVLVGSDLIVTPLSPGVVTITLTATDLDLQSTPTSFLLTVNDSYSSWAARQAFPLPADALTSADPDNDGLGNFVEYALASPPLTSSAAALIPNVQQGHLAGNFKVRRFLADAAVSFETATTLAGPWTTRWNLSDGYTHPWIVSHADSSESTQVDFRDPDPAPPSRLFLRLKVTAP